MNAVALRVEDLEFVPERLYAALHGCGAAVIGTGEEMRDAMKVHTEECGVPTC